jgi:nucleoside-diphosphate-sugar epimerase
VVLHRYVLALDEARFVETLAERGGKGALTNPTTGIAGCCARAASGHADGTEAVRKGALDITRARTELGYEPRYPIKNGLAYIEATRAGRG